MSDRPTIEMSVERVVCARHGEPFRALWPAGYPVFMVKLWTLCMGSTELIEDATAKCAGDVNNAHDWTKAIGLALDVMPLCCRASDEEVLRCYLEAAGVEGSDFGPTKRCKGCGRKRPGAPYRTIRRKFSHMCFQCVVYQMRPMH